MHFADGEETMVALTFGPMKKLIEAFEKQQAKQKSTEDKKAKKTPVIFLVEIFQRLLTLDKLKFVCQFFFASEKWLNVK